MSNCTHNLLIRADGNTHIGTGHVMRCLALAQAWQERGCEVSFALAQHTPSLLARVSAEEIPVHLLDCKLGSPDDATQTIALAKQIGATWVVADGYHFDASYQQTIKASGLSLLVIDDYGHAEHYYADIVLNQNVSADESLYTNREAYTRLLLGTRHALLRREFWAYRGWTREIPDVARKILVTMGGGDPDNVTLKVLQGLNQIEDVQLDCTVVIGGSNPHINTLRTFNSIHSVQVLEDVRDMPALMAWADIAISAGGSTCWELSLLGLPMVLIPVADNQRPIAERLGKLDIALVLGWYENVPLDTIATVLNHLVKERETRLRMSQAGRTLVDGEGGKRVIDTMRNISGSVV